MRTHDGPVVAKDKTLQITVFLALLFSVLTVTAKSSVSTPAMSNQSPATDSTKPPEHPATEAQIREYFALTGSIRVIRELLSKTVAASRATAAPYYVAAYWDDMQSEFLKIDFEAKLVPIYQQFLSTEDMAEIIKFYRSPAGKRILATQAPITNESQAVFRKIGAEIGAQIYEKHKDEIEAAKKKYEASSAESK